MMRAILGGTFDPIHWGHLRPALAVSVHIEAQHLHLIPSAQPPHRSYPGATAEQRLAMAELAANELMNCSADGWELQQQRKSYTQLTLQQLHQRWPNDTLVFLLGEDAFAGLQSWFNWQQLLDHAHFVVMRRPHAQNTFSPALQQWLTQVQVDRVSALHQNTHGHVYLAETPAVNISATAIRQAIQANQPWQHWVPSSVADYIQAEELYR
ncbi:nicotinate-nucleotide adenylyltransferase [Pseudidiomarina gelatinasegens]|uniref:nicotinate-nucleotide adenylyltransferase n=1 Tax=Pseudidiomarina gelatinasegens TaxID=2487740 RepID=UPI0030ED7AB4